MKQRRQRAIRFARVIYCDLPRQITDSSLQKATTVSPKSVEKSSLENRRKTKTRTGCRECKLRRVKCDETFPVCLRCQRAGTVCRGLARLDQFQLELVGTFSLHNNAFQRTPHVNTKLLQAWFQRTSRIMVLENASNPLSIPLLHYCTTSPALVHVIQSITAGHDEFFQQSKLVPSLEERSKALITLRGELESGESTPISHLFTAYLLGVSSTFLDDQVLDFGQDHLFAARRMLETILLSLDHTDRMANFATGAFVYWDMTCSILLDPMDERLLPHDTLIHDQILNMDQYKHPITGFYTPLFYCLANLGRYCRAVLELGIHDSVVEYQFEKSLLEWEIDTEDELWNGTADAFRRHGLIMLYRLCGRQMILDIDFDYCMTSAEAKTEELTREHALSIVSRLLEIPLTSPMVVLQPMPLMTAGAELSNGDESMRKLVVSRFKALFSVNRVPASLHAVQLLEELWVLRDMNEKISWLELMLQKGWRLRLG